MHSHFDGRLRVERNQMSDTLKELWTMLYGQQTCAKLHFPMTTLAVPDLLYHYSY